MHVVGIMSLTDRKKISVFYCREAPICKQVRDGINTQLPVTGLKVVHEAQVSLAQPDFTAEVIAARNAGAEAVVVIMDNPSTIRVLRSMHRQGWKVPLSTQISAHDERFLKDGGADVEGVLTGAGVAPWSSSSKLAEYVAALRKYVPGGIQADVGAIVWAAGKTLEKIAGGFGDQVSSGDILNGLYGLRQETLGGVIAPTTWVKGPHADTNLCNVPIQIQGAKFTAPKGDAFSCLPGWKPAG